MQDALEATRGVKDVKISLSDNEAVVKYDPDQCKVDDLIFAVQHAHGMSKYDAKVKKE